MMPPKTIDQAGFVNALTFLKGIGLGRDATMALTFGEITAHCKNDYQVKQAVFDAAAEREALYLEPVTFAGPVHFLYEYVSTPREEDALADMPLTPTAALYKDGSTIAIFALDAPVAKADPKMRKIAKTMGGVTPRGRRRADPVSESIPMPGADGWRLIHLDASRRYSLADLARAA